MSNDEQPRPKPVHYDELFPGRFLKAGLFKGKSVTLRIRDVVVELMPQDKGGDRDRGILSFNETPLQLVLNRTNGECIKAMFGAAVKDWIGKRVTFAPEKDRFGRDIVDAIRVAGSPDLASPIDVEIKLPRKKPKTRRLDVTGKKQPAKVAPAPRPEPDPEGDPDPFGNDERAAIEAAG